MGSDAIVIRLERSWSRGYNWSIKLEHQIIGIKLEHPQVFCLLQDGHKLSSRIEVDDLKQTVNVHGTGGAVSIFFHFLLKRVHSLAAYMRPN